MPQAVLEPFSYIISNPGKDIRTQLMAAFNVWINVPEDKLKIIAKVVSMLHNASLMCASPRLWVSRARSILMSGAFVGSTI